jgi:phage tail sheath gpL-like
MSEQGMADRDIRATISDLVEEEHRLRQGEVDDTDRQKLTEIEEHLDQAWDLLRQRQALREAAQDPSAAQERPTGEVEGYLQ